MARPRSKLRGGETTTLQELLTEADRTRKLRLWKRTKAVLAYAAGYSIAEICHSVELSRGGVYGCWERYRSQGVVGLLEGQHSGRPPGLSPEQLLQLADILDSGPVAYGLDTGIWTATAIAQVIAVEFEVDYHPHHVCKLLHQLDFSVQRPTRQLAAADPQKQQKWVRRTYPAIKRGPGRKAR